MSDDVRRAYAAWRVEQLKMLLGGLLVAAGIGLFLVNSNSHLMSTQLGIAISGALLGFGIMVYRTTALWKTVQKGPRIPRRIRLPFDSVVEVTTMQIPVQQRTELVAADKKPPELT